MDRRKRGEKGDSALKEEKEIYVHYPHACTVYKWFRYLTGGKTWWVQLRRRSRLIEGVYKSGSRLHAPREQPLIF